MDNYMQFLGQTRTSISTMPMEKKESCLVCSRTTAKVPVNIKETVSDLKARLVDQMKLQNPALQGAKGFLIGAGVYAEQAQHKLTMTIEQLLEANEISESETFTLTDKSIVSSVELSLVIDRETPMHTE